MLTAGVLALAGSLPWLFPSLGPTAFLQAEYPSHRTTRFYNTLVGHCLGLGSGFAAVVAFHAQHVPPATASHLAATRIWAAALAVALTSLAMLLFRASHPPGVATALLVALGGFQATAPEGVKLLAGIAIFAVACAASRRLGRGRETRAEHAQERDP